MSAERDELAKLLYDAGAYCGNCEYAGYVTCPDCREVTRDYADKALSTGYRKHRTIITLKGMDELPVGTVVYVHDDSTGDGNAWQLFDDVIHLTDDFGDPAKTAWASPAYTREFSGHDLMMLSGEVTVLHEPEASK